MKAPIYIYRPLRKDFADFTTDMGEYPVREKWIRVWLLDDIEGIEGRLVLNGMMANAYEKSINKQLSFVVKDFKKWDERFTNGPDLTWVKDVVLANFMEKYAITRDGCLSATWAGMTKDERKFFTDAYLRFTSLDEFNEYVRQREAFRKMGIADMVYGANGKNLLIK